MDLHSTILSASISLFGPLNYLLKCFIYIFSFLCPINFPFSFTRFKKTHPKKILHKTLSIPTRKKYGFWELFFFLINDTLFQSEKQERNIFCHKVNFLVFRSTLLFCNQVRALNTKVTYHLSNLIILFWLGCV